MPPLVYREQDSPYLPINPARGIFRDPKDFFLYKHVLLPYFPDVDLMTLARLHDDETEPFVRFTHFLKRRVGALSEASSTSGVQSIVDEIEYEVAALTIEAKKLSANRILDGVHMSSFAISLGAMLSPVSPGVAGAIAGVVGSVTVLDLAKEWRARKEKELDLKKSDFYVPYLLMRRGGQK
jgi:hypothetical protein